MSSLSEPFTIGTNVSMKEAKLLSLNIDKASFDLGWLPTLDFDQTIDFVADWYRSFFSISSISTIEQIYLYTQIARSKSLPWA